MPRQRSVHAPPRYCAATLCLLVLAVAVYPTPGTAIELPGPRETWMRLQVDEVTVLSSTRPGATIELAESLQYIRAALEKVTRLKVRSPLPMTIFVFDHEKQYQGHMDAVLGHSGKRSAGVFQAHPDGDSIAIDYSGLSAGVQILYHELAHRFVKDTTPGAPLWLNEGLAELYSTFSRSGDKISIGHARVDHIRTLAEHPLIPLSSLFAVNHQSPDYNESSSATVFYAESWAFVHYLLIGRRERQGQLAAFLGFLAAGKDTEVAFREAFSADFATLEVELRGYVQKKLFPYVTMRVGELPVAPRPKPEAVPRDAILVELGTFLSRTSPTQLGDAELLLREALKTNPANADAWAMIGVLKVQQGSAEEANAAFEKAVQVGPESFCASLYYAQSIMRRTSGRFVVPQGGPPTEVKLARELFARSVELRPEDARGYAGLGSTFLFQRDDLEPGVAALEKALSLAPSQVDVAYNLVQLYLETDQAAKASPLIEGVLAHFANPALTEEARRALRRRSGAQPGAAPEATPTRDPETERMMKEIDERNAEWDKEYAQYQAFAALVNAGDYREALAAADTFLQTAKSDALISEVTEIRAQLVERLAKTRQ